MPDINIAEARKAYQQAQEDLKAAGGDATKRKMALDARKKAGADIDLYKAMQGGTYHADIIERDTKKLAVNSEKVKPLNKEIAAARRKGYIAKAVYEMDRYWASAKDVNEYLAKTYPNQKITVTQEELRDMINEAKSKKLTSPDNSMKPGKAYYQSFWKEMDAAKLKKSQIEKENKVCLRNIEMSKTALKKAEEAKKNQASSGGSGYAGGYGGGVLGGTEENPTLTKPYKDENGNVVATATYNKDGKIQEVQFKDEKGNDRKLKADELKNANVNIDDVRNALESGDLKKAMELLLSALLSKQRGNQQAAASKETLQEYTDKETGVLFSIEKENKEIKAVRMVEDKDTQLVITKEMFEKAGVNPKDVEKALEAKDYAKAAYGLYTAAEKNGLKIDRDQEPQLAVKGESIILTDADGNEFKLTEEYLKSNGMKKSRASGTMKKLQEALAVKPRPKGLEAAVATYFAGEKPAPRLPEGKEGNWSVSKLNKTLLNQGVGMAGVSSSAISITVTNDSGTKKKLKAEDFANYFHCDKKEGKKILKAYARAIEDGADLNGILSEIADGKTSSKTKSKDKTKDSSNKKSGFVSELATESGKKAKSQIKNHVDTFTTQQISKLSQKVLGI